MSSSRCPLKCNCNHNLSRRQFIRSSAGLVAGSVLLQGCNTFSPGPMVTQSPIRACGPASKYAPTIKAAFVRRKEDYGMWWPGAIYDGRAARQKYTAQLVETAGTLGVKFDLRSEPIYSTAEADAWLAEAKADEVDGLMVLLLDRQQHAWPTVHKALDTGIPTVVFSPVGTSFTTNTIELADKPGCVIYSTDDFSQVAYGMKMLKAGPKIRRARCIVLKGKKRFDASRAEDMGITWRYVPVQTYLDEYRSMPVTDEILALADQYIRRARRRTGATRQEVINGAKGYFVARNILEREGGDAISIAGCVSMVVERPCIAWSRFNDQGVPAACEADEGAAASLLVVNHLFDRPGFVQDPVADTARQAIIGAHCVCATRLNGFNQPPEPFDLTHHHGNQDATVRTLWRKGQRVTAIDVQPGDRTKILISAGTVLDNIDVPPAGGCVVQVVVKFDGDQEVLSFPGFHQVFFYGDYKHQLVEFCRLFNFEAQVV